MAFNEEGKSWFWETGAQGHAPASWSAVAERHGASLPRRHRLRGVKSVLLSQFLNPPAKAASRNAPASTACHRSLEWVISCNELTVTKDAPQSPTILQSSPAPGLELSAHGACWVKNHAHDVSILGQHATSPPVSLAVTRSRDSRLFSMVGDDIRTPHPAER